MTHNALYLVALLVGLGVAAWRTRRRVLLVDLFALFGLAGVVALLGARAAWVVVALARGASLGIEHVFGLEGGFGSIGALGALGALLVWGVPSLLGPRADRLALADDFVLAGFAALGVARLACVWRGCDFGVASSTWPPAMSYHEHAAPAVAVLGAGVPTAPMALYLSCWTLGAVAAVWLLGERLSPGRAARAVLVLYLTGRALIESLRHPLAGAHVDGVNVNQISCIVALVCVILVSHFIFLRAGRPSAGEYAP